jgi:hypothetical protein
VPSVRKQTTGQDAMGPGLATLEHQKLLLYDA